MGLGSLEQCWGHRQCQQYPCPAARAGLGSSQRVDAAARGWGGRSRCQGSRPVPPQCPAPLLSPLPPDSVEDLEPNQDVLLWCWPSFLLVTVVCCFRLLCCFSVRVLFYCLCARFPRFTGAVAVQVLLWGAADAGSSRQLQLRGSPALGEGQDTV